MNFRALESQKSALIIAQLLMPDIYWYTIKNLFVVKLQICQLTIILEENVYLKLNLSLCKEFDR